MIQAQVHQPKGATGGYPLDKEEDQEDDEEEDKEGEEGQGDEEMKRRKTWIWRNSWRGRRTLILMK